MPPRPCARLNARDHDAVAKERIAPQGDGDRIVRTRGEDLGHVVGSGGRIVTAHDSPLSRSGSAENGEIEEGRLSKQPVGVEMVPQRLRAGRSRREKKQKRPRKILSHGLRVIGAENRSMALKFPSVTDKPRASGPYRMAREGYTFVLDRANVEKLKTLPDFEGREEPALAEDFLDSASRRGRKTWRDAGAAPGEVSVSVDPHQRKAHLFRGATKLFSADIYRRARRAAGAVSRREVSQVPGANERRAAACEPGTWSPRRRERL